MSVGMEVSAHPGILTIRRALNHPNDFARLLSDNTYGIYSHPKFSGGPAARVLDRDGYQVTIAAPAGPVGPLESGPRFIQVSWSPAAALPDTVDERLDLDGRGRPQVRLRFQVPRDPGQPLTGMVEVLDSGLVRPVSILRRTGGPGLLVRLDHSIVARIPLN